MTGLTRLPVVLVAFGLVLACASDRAMTPRVGGLSATISDGNHSNGSKTLFFLPPVVASPAGNQAFDEVSANAGIPPAVEICPLDGTGTCGPRLVRYTTTSGDGDEVLRFDAAARHFFVNWHTDHFELAPLTTYRIRVLRESDNFELGFADVDVVDSGKELKSVDTGEFIALLDGRTLPIKFQTKLGQFCSNTSDCAEQVVTDAGGDVITNTGFAAASFPNDWLPGDLTEVVVVIERVDLSGEEPGIEQTKGRRCHASDLEEAEGCYNYRTIPDLGDEDEEGGFNGKLARVEVCIEIPDTDPSQDRFQLHKSDAGERPVALREVVALLIDCGGFQGLASRGGGFWNLAGGTWHVVRDAIAAALAPRPLFATAVANLGLGGETGSFSNIGWARPATMQVLSERDQSAVVGTSVPSAPTVRVVTLHPEEAPDEGADVLFTVVGGGGRVAGADFMRVTTPADGMASVTWTLGPKLTEQENRIMVSTPFVDNSPLFLTARPLIRQNDPAIGCDFDANFGYGFRIVFDWAGDATGYRIVVHRQGSPLPRVDQLVGASEFTLTTCNDFVSDANLGGWQWQFRADDGEGNVGEWSALFSFAFEPCRLEDGSACNAPPIN